MASSTDPRTTHVVMFRLADPDDVEEALVRLRGMAGRIRSLRSVRAGRNSNASPAAFDVVLVTEHDDPAGLAEYAAHPVHQEVLEWLKARWTDRAVVDTDRLA
ncbi:MAG: Dabb family protein [Candidatus Nanopelagicales bacterium]|nr:Dabb family protein [Candidatus Nanopelagicales bacterium]